MPSAKVATMKTAALSFNASGDNAVIAAVAGSPIRVHGILATAAAAVNITFYSDLNATGTALSGAIVLTAAGSSIFLPISDEPYFTTVIGKAFNVYTSGGVALTGTIWYTVG